MRFFLDNDVPVSVGRMLRQLGYDCWTAADAGIADESRDDNLSVYATEHQAALVTLDREFTMRRRRNPIGRHIGLRCTEPEALEVLAVRLEEILAYLNRDHVTLVVSKLEVKADSSWS